ncbi:MAG: hypothetical protein QME60_07070 [Verrucomicrobiota bacterium]|nr:hypothetical protein [Verrucomicrobiota bacterium]
MLLRLAKFIMGLLLIPACIAVTRTVVSLILAIQPSPDVFIPAPALALIGGFALWLLIYAALPRPARAYVLAHELTHALWGALMGARILNMKIRRNAGSVTLSKSNFLVSLAPYFFPLYTVIVIAAYYGCSLFMTNVQDYYLGWLGLVGLTWGFHFTFTLGSLFQRQSDIRENGRLFSYAVIYTLNALGIAFWIILVSSATWRQLADFLKKDLVAAALLACGWLARIHGSLGARQ